MTRTIHAALVVALATVNLVSSAQRAWGQGPHGTPRLGVTAVEYRQAARDDRPSRKDPGTATLVSIFVIGGGQIYAGEVGKGLLMLGGATGAFIAGAVASSCDVDDCDSTPLVLGTVALLGTYVYSIIDAGPSARRMNKKNGYPVSGSVHPVIRSGLAGTSQLGLSVAVRLLERHG